MTIRWKFLNGFLKQHDCSRIVVLLLRQPIVRGIETVTGQSLWDPSIRFLTELPAKTDPFEVLLICVMAMGLSFLATLYPSYRAAGTYPVQVLRYE